MLSLVNASYGIVSGIIGAISPPDVDQAFMDGFLARLDEVKLPIESIRGEVEVYYTNIMLSAGNISAAKFLFYSIEMIGIVMMYRYNRMGFSLYVLSQLGLAFLPAIFGGFNQFGSAVMVATLIWNAIWVLVYLLQVRKLPKR
jgi:hypothetical protein